MKRSLLCTLSLAALLLTSCSSGVTPKISMSFENSLEDSGLAHLKGTPSKNGQPAYAEGVHGKCLTLKDGFWVDLAPTDLDLAHGLTMEAWVKSSEVEPSNIGGIRTIDFVEFGTEDSGIPAGISSELSLGIMVPSKSVPPQPAVAEAMAFGGMAKSAKPFPLNEWVHLAMTYDPGKKKMALFVNGDKVSDNNAQAPTPYKIIRIGRNATGQIDELRIYDQALSPEQIKKDAKKP